MAKFIVGDRVGEVHGKLKYSEYDGPSYGAITDTLSDGTVMVNWDDKWKNDRRQPINPNKLVPETELKQKYSELERAFLKVQAEVQEKLAVAGAAILEADKIASAAGLNLQEMRDATEPLESAMENAGWQTSSWHC